MCESKSADQPLNPEPILSIDQDEPKAERFWKSLPVLGWAIASSLWDRRVAPIVAAYSTQLKDRTEIDPHVWGDDRRQSVAAIVCQAAKKEMGWPNNRFLPDDPVQVVFWSHEDGLDSVAAFMEIEDRLKIKVPDEVVQAWFEKNLRDMVEELVARVGRKET